ncbi:hypothetical protein N7528_001523 [Penicillium herquei]|nr:hypothetical protein N7528_001523 [Penicillium herquei]
MDKDDMRDVIDPSYAGELIFEWSMTAMVGRTGTHSSKNGRIDDEDPVRPGRPILPVYGAARPRESDDQNSVGL